MDLAASRLPAAAQEVSPPRARSFIHAFIHSPEWCTLSPEGGDRVAGTRWDPSSTSASVERSARTPPLESCMGLGLRLSLPLPRHNHNRTSPSWPPFKQPGRRPLTPPSCPLISAEEPWAAPHPLCRPGQGAALLCAQQPIVCKDEVPGRRRRCPWMGKVGRAPGWGTRAYTLQTHPGSWASAPGQMWGCT